MNLPTSGGQPEPVAMAAGRIKRGRQHGFNLAQSAYWKQFKELCTDRQELNWLTWLAKQWQSLSWTDLTDSDSDYDSAFDSNLNGRTSNSDSDSDDGDESSWVMMMKNYIYI